MKIAMVSLYLPGGSKIGVGYQVHHMARGDTRSQSIRSVLQESRLFMIINASNRARNGGRLDSRGI
jgi:hypothetical protein